MKSWEAAIGKFAYMICQPHENIFCVLAMSNISTLGLIFMINV